MRRRRVDVQEVVLKYRRIHRLSCASRNDQELLLREAQLNPLSDVPPPVVIGGGYVNASAFEVIPTEHLFRPDLEAVQEVKVASVGKCEFVLTIKDEPFNR